MRLASVLAAMCSVGLVAACSTGGQAPTAKTSPSPEAPSPVVSTPESSPTPLVIPPPTVPFVRCDAAVLEMQLVRVGVALGNVGGLIELRNASSHGCDLYGYAAVQLLNSHGHALPTKLLQSTSSYLFGANNVEEVVALPAGTVAINPDRPIPGHAYIPISWNDAQEPCTLAAQLKVTPPGGLKTHVITAIGYIPGLVSFCSGGTVIVNPIRAAFYN
jgi:hypothetical protein